MATKLSIHQFTFQRNGYGHYYVTYITKSGKIYRKIIDDMSLIDSTKNAEFPTSKALGLLRKKIQEVKY